jgi:O-6-methylguanine DNA methyltransferase
MTATERREPTVFERRVYDVVRTIPAGQVRSYAWVAQQLGNVGWARAVGQALHRNPWPGQVPCHRVVRSDGALGGFAWGLEKKRQLLREEGVALPAEPVLRRRRPSSRRTSAY